MKILFDHPKIICLALPIVTWKASVESSNF